jgi:hypothetical protein
VRLIYSNQFNKTLDYYVTLRSLVALEEISVLTVSECNEEEHTMDSFRNKSYSDRIQYIFLIVTCSNCSVVRGLI